MYNSTRSAISTPPKAPHRDVEKWATLFFPLEAIVMGQNRLSDIYDNSDVMVTNTGLLLSRS